MCISFQFSYGIFTDRGYRFNFFLHIQNRGGGGWDHSLFIKMAGPVHSSASGGAIRHYLTCLVSGSDQLLPPASQCSSSCSSYQVSVLSGEPLLQTSPRTALPAGYRVSGLLILNTTPSWSSWTGTRNTQLISSSGCRLCKGLLRVISVVNGKEWNCDDEQAWLALVSSSIELEMIYELWGGECFSFLYPLILQLNPPLK